jgi:hypothetical protein
LFEQFESACFKLDVCDVINKCHIASSMLEFESIQYCALINRSNCR